MQPPWTAWHPRCRSPAHAVAWISRKTDGSAKRYSFHDQCTPCTAEEKYESGAAEYDFCSHLDAAPACTCSEGGGSWETWADGAGPLTREGAEKACGWSCGQHAEVTGGTGAQRVRAGGCSGDTDRARAGKRPEPFARDPCPADQGKNVSASLRPKSSAAACIFAMMWRRSPSSPCMAGSRA